MYERTDFMFIAQVKDVNSAESCQAECAANDQCQVFTWQAKQMRCFLYPGEGAELRPGNMNQISGPKTGCVDY
jgi:hypothetical protein